MRTAKSKSVPAIDIERRIKNLAKKHGTPLMAISRSALLQQIKRFKKTLPRVKAFYAVKANSEPEIIKTVCSTGIGFDVASSSELQAVIRAGAKPDKIIFANTVKPSNSIKDAVDNGVKLFTFDSEYELDKIAETAPGSSVVVRIKVPNVGSMVELSLKFGVEPADAVPLLIKAHKLGLKPAGVSFHVGSQCTHIENYIDALEMSAIIVRDAALKRIPINIVDIGGGFPIRHFDHDEDHFDKLAAVISKELARLFEPNIRIIAEPGRFIAGPAAVLITTVIGKAIRENKHWYYLDDGVYGDLSGLVFDHANYQFKSLKTGKRRLSTLAGPTCDSFDIIARGEDLPELEIGDILYVQNIGAYSSASATNFNGIRTAKLVMVQ
jgi:ornithine decarboxylase